MEEKHVRVCLRSTSGVKLITAVFANTREEAVAKAVEQAKLFRPGVKKWRVKKINELLPAPAGSGYFYITGPEW
jgi:hypothetical protein